MAVDLSRFDNSHYHPGRPWIVQVLWFLFGLPLLRCSLIPSSAFRRALLRLFGANIGTGVVIKPGFRVKYPWLFTTGDHCWLGEDSWIDNLAQVTLGNNVCISQGAYLCTGNHNWSDTTFELIVRFILVEDGAWIGARSSIGPGVVIGAHGIAGFGAVVNKSIPPFEIHMGNPAGFLRLRRFNDLSPRRSPASLHSPAS